MREKWLNPSDLVAREPEVVPGYPNRFTPKDEEAAQELKNRTLTNLYNAQPQWLTNAHAVLERLSQTLRERRRGQQELKAMTAETRASAWILSALPIVVGLLTLTANPAYLTGMWTDPGGRQLLLWALGLQIAGMLLLFRMARID